jgi:hypothetical protein
LTTTLFAPAAALAAMFEEQVIEGGSVSFTMTVKAQLAIPAVFETVQVTVLVPTGNA